MLGDEEMPACQNFLPSSDALGPVWQAWRIDHLEVAGVFWLLLFVCFCLFVFSNKKIISEWPSCS